MGIEVTVIDASDHVGWLASATRFGEVYMSDVPSMVKAVIEGAGESLISRLNVLDHGSKNGLSLGKDWVTAHNVSKFAPELKKISPILTRSAFVHLQHCEVGHNKMLLLELARIFGNSVYATPNFSNPIYRVNFGATKHTGWLSGKVKAIPNPFKSFEVYNRADPDGTFAEDVDFP